LIAFAVEQAAEKFLVDAASWEFVVTQALQISFSLRNHSCDEFGRATVPYSSNDLETPPNLS
jgi:hypothetical protein